MNTSPLLMTSSPSTNACALPDAQDLMSSTAFMKVISASRSDVLWQGLQFGSHTSHLKWKRWEMVNKCSTCTIHHPEWKKPFLSSSFPDYPWACLGMDLIELNNNNVLFYVLFFQIGTHSPLQRTNTVKTNAHMHTQTPHIASTW